MVLNLRPARQDVARLRRWVGSWSRWACRTSVRCPRALPHSERVSAMALGLAAAGSALWAGALAHLGPAAAPHMPWWVLAIAYVVVNACVVHISVFRQTHTFTLTEIPLVLGLLFAQPTALLVGAVVGTAVALGVLRQQVLVKAIFNTALCLAETAVAIAGFRLVLDGADPLGPRGWLAAMAATSTSSLLSALAVSAVVAGADRTGFLERFGRASTIALPVLLVNTVVGLGGARLAAHDLVATLVLVVPALVLCIAYRAYLRERQRYERVRLLYEASREFQRARSVEEAVRVLLRRALEMTAAETADLFVLPADSEGRALHYSLTAEAGGTIRCRPWTADGVVPRLIAQGHGLILPRARGRDRAAHSLLLGVRDAVIAPLVGEHGAFGCLVVSNRRGDVATFEAEDLAVLLAFAAQASVSIENGRLEAELERLAFLDALTGLANRALFVDRLRHLLQQRQRGSRDAVCVLFVDLDDFKLVNDSLGHVAGDQLLAEAARRLRSCLRSVDTAARLGGDEFAILVDDASTPEAGMAVAERILEALRSPFRLAGTEVSVTASIGVVVSREVTDGVEEILAAADLAMYRAKESGKARYELFGPEMHTAVLERHRLRVDLERALRRDELTVYFQPIVSLGNGRVVGAEALLRWEHPSRGLLAPDEFIAVAEETGLVVDLGRRVLERACRAAAGWRRTLPGFVVTVNLSARELSDVLVDDVTRVLESTHLDPAALVLEVTERITAASAAARAVLQRLRRLGVRVAIDDFGTGYSSLASLRELPVDILKMAKPFVDCLGPRGGEDGPAVATAIVRLGESLGLEVIAEGVERADQVAHLQELGCDLAQGYCLGRPMSAAECSLVLAEQAAWNRGMVRLSARPLQPVVGDRP